MEKRKYPRFPVRYDVLCTDIDETDNKNVRAIAENASRTGLKIRFSGSLRNNANLKLKILKSIASEPITAHARVVWEKKSTLVYGERIAGIHITKIAWTQTDCLINNLDF